MKLTIGKMILKGIGFALVLSAFSGSAWASITPEMDPGLATSAMALLAGGMAMIGARSRRK
jgi:hypothetical protein